MAVLIFYIFRKSENINLEEISRPGGFLPAKPKNDFPKTSRVAQFFLAISEKITQGFKSFSLNIYTKTDKIFQSIKEKRNKNQILKRENAEKLDKPQENKIDLLRKTPESSKEIQFRRKRENNFQYRKKEEALPPRPTVSQEMVQPETSRREKDEFEQLLIERIADNPKDIEAYERLGTYYIEVGNFSDSLECFDQVLRLSPANRRARIQTRRLQKILGK